MFKSLKFPHCSITFFFLCVNVPSLIYCFELNSQEFTLFTEPYPDSHSCIPTPNSVSCLRKSFSDNIKNLSALWEPAANREVKSWCSATQGMWLFYSEPDFGLNSSYYGFVKTSRPKTPGSCVMQCVNLPQNQGQGQGQPGQLGIQSIRHFTHANLSTPAFSLFTKEGGIHQRELFLDGDAISLPTPVSFGAFAFSGFKPWTVFPLPGFQGPPTCLKLPRDYDESRDAREVALLSVQINVALTLGSARIGCTQDQNEVEVAIFPLNTTTAVLSLTDTLTLFMERGSSSSSSSNISIPTATDARFGRFPLRFGRRPRPAPTGRNTPAPILLPELDHNSTNPGFFLGVEIEVNPGNGNSTKKTQRLYFSGAELVLPQILNVSFFYPVNSKRTGGNSTSGEWELCSDLDFTGSCLCLRANSSRVTFNPRISLMSAKFGCSSSKPSPSGGGPEILVHFELLLSSIILLILVI